MEEKGFRERRQYARLSIRSRVLFRIMEAADKEPLPEKFEAAGKNIGVAGILLNSDKELKPGTFLEMSILMPRETDSVDIKGEVRWCSPCPGTEQGGYGFDTGVQFLTIDKKHVLLLVKYVCGNLDEKLKQYIDPEIADE
ncbi:MAG: PilZ domain-containing protein [Candidatus Omnitrophica bacterium]|nr:PilZ domain-containing protein [Candidatus Omnitrophota bacterium]